MVAPTISGPKGVCPTSSAQIRMAATGFFSPTVVAAASPAISAVARSSPGTRKVVAAPAAAPANSSEKNSPPRHPLLSAHIPFIVKGPQGVRTRLGIPAAVDSDAVVGLQDVMPTILEACGLEPPTSVDGRSVLPALADPTGDWRAAIHGEHSACYDRRCEMQYLTDGRQKYIWLAHDGSEQLFDLTIDPYEEHDLAADPDHHHERDRWRAQLVAILIARGCGWVQDGQLVPRGDGPPLVSPHYADDSDGTE